MMQGQDGVNDDGLCNMATNSQEKYPTSSGDEDPTSTAGPIRRENNGTKNMQYDLTDVPCFVRCEALRLNHEAVNIFTSGTGEEKAFKILKLALSRMKDKLAPSARQEGRRRTSTENRSTIPLVDDEVSMQQDADARLIQSWFIHDLSCLQVPVSLSRTDISLINNQNESFFFFYSKLLTFHLCSDIRLNDNMASSCLSSMIDSETLSSTIIYNIATLLTIRGIRTNSSVVLKQAMDLYELSLSLLPHPSSKMHHSSITRSLAIVSWNNLGQIAYLLRDHDHVQAMREMLHTLLTTEPFTALSADEQEWSGGASPPPPLVLFEDVEIQGFKTNIMFMYPPNTAPAA